MDAAHPRQTNKIYDYQSIVFYLPVYFVMSQRSMTRTVKQTLSPIKKEVVCAV